MHKNETCFPNVNLNLALISSTLTLLETELTVLSLPLLKNRSDLLQSRLGKQDGGCHRRHSSFRRAGECLQGQKRRALELELSVLINDRTTVLFRPKLLIQPQKEKKTLNKCSVFFMVIVHVRYIYIYHIRVKFPFAVLSSAGRGGKQKSASPP